MMKALDFLDNDSLEQAAAPPVGVSADAFLDAEPPGMLDRAVGAVKGMFQPAAPEIPSAMAPAHAVAPQPAPPPPVNPMPAMEPGAMQGFQTNLQRLGMLGPQTPQQTFEDIGAAGQALGSLATAPVGLAGAGLAGLGATVAGAPLPNIAQAASEAMQGLTYQPESAGGQEAAGLIGYPFEKLHEAGDALTQSVYEKTESPFLAALIGSLPELAPALLPFIGRRAKPPAGLQLSKQGAAEWSRGQSVAAELRDIARTKGTNSPEWEAALNKYVRGEELKAQPAPEPGPAPEPMAPKSEFAKSQFEDRFMRQAPPEPKVEAIVPEPPKAPPAPERPFYPPATPRPAAPPAEPLNMTLGEVARPPAESPRALPAPGGTNARQIRENQGQPLPPEPQERDAGGRGAEAGQDIRGQDLQRQAETQPASGDPGERIVQAYRDLKAERGISNIDIADIRDKAGVTQAEIDKELKRMSAEGSAVLALGDRSVVDDRIKSGGVALEEGGEPNLLVKMQEPEKAPAGRTMKRGRIYGPEAFEPTELSHEIDISEIIPRQAVTDSEKLLRGVKKLKAGVAGVGPKRPPLTLVVQENGYKVLDGNTTLKILKDMGAQKAVATVSSKVRQSQADLDKIYQDAERSIDEHREYTEQLAGEFGGVAKFRPERIGPMKSKARAEEKAISEEGGHAEYLTDILASTVLFEDLGKMRKAYETMKDRPEVFDARDRYDKPLGEYRDYNFKIRLPQSGHVVEVQFNTPAMFEAKEFFGHKFYELERSLRGKQDNPRLAQIGRDAAEVQRLYYGKVFSELDPLDTQGAIRLAASSEISSVLSRILNAAAASETGENFPLATKKILDDLSSKYKPSGESNQRPPLSSTPDIVESPPISSQNIAPPPGNVKQKFTGSEQKLIVPGKGTSPVRFALMETADIIPSHKPMTFARNPDYPADVQERLYHSDKEEQAKVITRSQHLKTNLLLTNNPDAVNGPPIVTPDGVVLGGNSRAMLVERAYNQDAQFGKGTHYKEKLGKFANQFGLTTEQVNSMERPQLVRVMDPPDNSPGTLRRLASDFNRSLTQGMSQEAQTVSMGKNVSPRLIESIGDALANSDKTIRDYLDTKGVAVLDKLAEDGVVPATDRSRYVSAKYNKLNDAGKDLVEKVLLGSVVDDADLLTSAPREQLNKIGRALPDIIKVKARGEQWDITPQLKEALDVVTLAKAGDNKTLAQYYAQQGLFGEEKNGDPVVRALAEKLWSKETGLVKFAGLWRDYARYAGEDIKNQNFMFAPKSPQDAFREVFGAEMATPKAPEKPPGSTLYSGIPIPEIARFMGKLGDLYTRKVGEPVWDRFVMERLPKILEHVPGGKAVNRALIYDYRGDLPMTDRYIESMEDMQRGQAAGREYAIDLGKRLQSLPEDAQIRMGEAIRGELELDKLPPAEGRLAMEAVRAMTELGRQAVDAGLLSEETYFKNVGKYMPRLYTSKEYQGLLTKYGLTKPNRLDLSRFKKRKDIPKEVREEMGEILTPGYPIAKGITQMAHDIEMSKFFNGIADTEEWAWTRSLPKEYYDEVKADLLAAKKANAADEVPLEEIVALVQKEHPEALIDIREDAMGRQRVVIENGKPIPEGFQQLPKNKRLGRLSEAYVHPEIYNDLNDAIRIMGEGEKILRKGLASWKFGKVVASPKTHIRNMMSNSVLAHLGGMPMYEQPVYLWRAAAEMKNNGDLWKEAKTEGVLKDTFVQAELRQMFDALPELGGTGRSEDLPAALGKMQAVFDVGRKITGGMSRLYELEEQWFKMAKFIHSKERQGMSPKEAAADAQKWLFDYSKVTRFQRKYRESLWGAPFATFTFKAIPRIAEAAVKTPWRFAVPGAIVLAIEEAARRHIGDSKEEREAKKKARPEYMKTRDFMGIPNYVRWPFVDEYGREHYLNLTYILPWGDLAEGGDFAGIPGALRPMSHPLTNELAQQIMNYDAFKKENIVKEKDTAGMGKAEALWTEAKIRGRHAFNTFAPTLATDAVKAYESVRGKPDYRGRERAPGVVLSDTLAGVKLYPVDYADERVREANRLNPETGRIGREIKADIRTLAVKAAAVTRRGGDAKQYQDEISGKIRQLQRMGVDVSEYLGETAAAVRSQTP